MELYAVVAAGKMNLTYRKKRFRTKQEDRETIRHISDTLDKIHMVLSRPQNKVLIIMNAVGTGITLLGIITIIDIIRNWIGG